MQVLARGQLPPVSQAWRERIIADAGVEGGKIPTHVERPSEPSGPPPTLPDFE
jgi:hypothetical protein